MNCHIGPGRRACSPVLGQPGLSDATPRRFGFDVVRAVVYPVHGARPCARWLMNQSRASPEAASRVPGSSNR